MWAVADRQGTNTGYVAFGFAFGDEPDDNGIAANDIFIEWWGQTDARWQYNPDTENYQRFTDGQPHFDAADGVHGYLCCFRILILCIHYDIAAFL